MLPMVITSGLERAQKASPAKFWNVKPYGRLDNDRCNIVWSFYEHPDQPVTVGEVVMRPGQRPTWEFDQTALQKIEQLAQEVGVSFEHLRDTDPDPFKEQNRMSEKPNGTKGRMPTAVSTTEPTPAASPAPVVAYADRGEIRELVARFKAGLSLKNADEHEYLALAHLCAKYAIDPFNGEAWIIPNNGVMVGIKGLRKMANRQADDLGCKWWTEYLDVRNDDEAEKYGVPKGAKLAKVCVLRRSDHIEAWTAALKVITEAAPSLPYEVIKEAIGAPPVFTGIGYVMPDEKSKMPLGQLAMKRAEAHAIKQAFDVDQRTEGDDSYQATEIQITRVEDPAPQIEAPDNEPDVEEATVVEETPAPAPESVLESDDMPDAGADSEETPETPQSAPEAPEKAEHKPMVEHAQQAIIEQLKTESPITFIEAAELLNKALGTEYEPQGYYLSIVQSIRARRPELPKTEAVEITDVWADCIALAVAA